MVGWGGVVASSSRSSLRSSRNSSGLLPDPLLSANSVAVEGEHGELATPSSSVFASGSIWGSVFNLCTATLGAGCLSLPHAFQQMGVIPAVALCILTGMASHWAIILLADALEATGCTSYEEVAVHAFGKRNGQLVGAAVFLIVFGSAVAYTIALGDIIEPFVAHVSEHAGAPWLTRELCLTVVWAVLMVPLSLVDKVSQLQFTSLFAVLALAYLAIAMSVHFAIDASIAPEQTVGKVHLVEFDTGTASALALVLFAYTCQMNVPSICFELNDRSARTMSAVSSRAMAICAAIYIAIGFVGYADFPTSTQGDLLKNYCLITPSLTSFSSAQRNFMVRAQHRTSA